MVLKVQIKVQMVPVSRSDVEGGGEVCCFVSWELGPK